MRVRSASRWLGLGLLLTAALGAGLCCVRREGESPAPAASAAGEDQVAPTPREPAPTLKTQGQDAGAPIEGAAEPQAPSVDDPPDDSPLNPVAQFMRNSDQYDREFLATVERETKKSPSPEVMELLALRRSGATPGELERYIDTELGGDVRVRAAARRWLRESHGGAAPQASPRPGQGGAERSIQPVGPR
jgi:hypothetical protein